MASHWKTAKAVRERKEARPQDYCDQCLWNEARSGPCPRHPRPQSTSHAHEWATAAGEGWGDAPRTFCVACPAERT